MSKVEAGAGFSGHLGVKVKRGRPSLLRRLADLLANLKRR